MATGPASVKAIAEATGIPVGTVDRIARVLKQHQPPLWARSIPGNGSGSEHVRPEHLANLALGLTTEAIATAVEQVLWLRELVPATTGPSSPFVPGATFANAIEGWIDALSEQNGRLELERRFVHAWVTVKQHGDRRQFGFMEALPDGGKPSTLQCLYEAPQREMEAASKAIPAGSYTTSKSFTQGLLYTMADLWIDTQAHYASTTQGPLTIDPETKKAAGAPPPNGFQHSSKQAAKPASGHTAQSTHTHQSEQSPDRGLSFPPSSEKAYRHEHESGSDRPCAA